MTPHNFLVSWRDVWIFKILKMTTQNHWPDDPWKWCSYEFSLQYFPDKINHSFQFNLPKASLGFSSHMLSKSLEILFMKPLLPTILILVLTLGLATKGWQKEICFMKVAVFGKKIPRLTMQKDIKAKLDINPSSNSHFNWYFSWYFI